MEHTWRETSSRTKFMRCFAAFAGAGTLLLAVLGMLLSRSAAEALFLLFVLLLLLWAAVSDHAHGTIPFTVCVLLAVLSFAAALFGVPPRPQSRLLGLFLGAALPLLARAFFLLRGREALGMGDVSYLSALGLCLGAGGVLFALIPGSFFTAIAGAVLKRRRLPFAPALSLAAAGAAVLLLL